jgi:O-antigen/teichoic acid export membrane protein
MQLLARVAKNASFTLVAQVLARLVRMGYVLVMARMVSEAEFGFYNFGSSLALILTALSSLGLETMIVREIVRDPDRARSYLGSALVFKTVLSAAVLAVTAAFGAAIGLEQRSQVALLLISAALVLGDFSELLMGVVRAYQHMEWEIVFTLAEGVFFLFFFSLAVLLRADFLGLLVALVLACISQSAAALWLVCARFHPPLFSRRIKEDLALLRISAPVGLGNFAGSLNNNSGVLLLPFFRGAVETGLYGAAYSLVKGFGLLPRSLGIATLPVFSHLHTTSRESLQRAYRRAAKLILVIMLPASAALYVLSQPIILLLYSERYAAAVAPMRVFSLTFSAMLMNTLGLNLLYAADQQKIAGLLRTLSIALNVGLLVVLIPLWGGVGAAMSLLAANLFLLIAVAWAIQQRVCACAWSEILGKPLLCVAFASALFYLLARWSALGATLAALVVYPLSLAAVRTFSAEEVAWMRALLGYALNRIRRQATKV